MGVALADVHIPFDLAELAQALVQRFPGLPGRDLKLALVRRSTQGRQKSLAEDLHQLGDRQQKTVADRLPSFVVHSPAGDQAMDVRMQAIRER